MNMYGPFEEYVQGENRRKRMTSEELMHFYGRNAQRKKSAIKQFGVFLSKALATRQHRAGLAMPADAASPASAHPLAVAPKPSDSRAVS